MRSNTRRDETGNRFGLYMTKCLQEQRVKPSILKLNKYKKYIKEKKQHQKLLIAVTNYDYSNSYFLDLFKNSCFSEPRTLLLSCIKEKIPVIENIPNIHSDLADFIKNQTNPLLSTIREPVNVFIVMKCEQKKLKRDLIYHLSLNNNDNEQIWQVFSIETMDVSRIPNHFPVKGYWIHKSQHIHNLWYNRTQLEKQPDRQMTRNIMHGLNPSNLQLDISDNQSAIIVDAHKLKK